MTNSIYISCPIFTNWEVLEPYFMQVFICKHIWFFFDLNGTSYNTSVCLLQFPRTIHQASTLDSQQFITPCSVQLYVLVVVIRLGICSHKMEWSACFPVVKWLPKLFFLVPSAKKSFNAIKFGPIVLLFCRGPSLLFCSKLQSLPFATRPVLPLCTTECCSVG